MDESREITYRRLSDERIELSREGDAEPQYVARRHYLTYRRDEPAQVFERTGDEFASLQDAVEACVINAAAVAAAQGADFDGGLSFSEGRAGEWTAREFDTIGSDWRIEAGRWLVEDVINGGEPEWVEDEDGLRAFVESEVDKGWF